MLAFFGCLAQLAVIYAVDVFCKKNWLKAVLVSAAVVRTTYTYPAVSPVRTLFPLLLCAYMVFLYKNQKEVWGNRWMWMGFLLCSGAVLWNTETGLACIAGFVFYILVEQWQRRSVFGKGMSVLYFSVFAASLGCVCLAVVVLNIYNWVCGYPNLVFRVFFYPYINSSFATEGIRCNLPLGNHAWVYIIILLLGAASWAIYHTYLWKRRTEYMEEAPVLAGIAMIGIVAFAYYANEAHWGCMEIVHQIAIIVSAVILSKLWHVLGRWKEYNHVEHIFQKAVVVVAVAIYSTLAVAGALGDPVRISARNRAGAYSLAEVKADLETLRKEIPENTYGVGLGINTAYCMLQWDNHAKLRDTSAVSINASGKGNAFTELRDEILCQDSFLIESKYSWDQDLLGAVLKRDDTYVLRKTVSIGGVEYGYYVREK